MASRSAEKSFAHRSAKLSLSRGWPETVANSPCCDAEALAMASLKTL